jgi:hypothetical protein
VAAGHGTQVLGLAAQMTPAPPASPSARSEPSDPRGGSHPPHCGGLCLSPLHLPNPAPGLSRSALLGSRDGDGDWERAASASPNPLSGGRGTSQRVCREVRRGCEEGKVVWAGEERATSR